MPGAGQVRLRVLACGVCRTDLHIVDGELPRRRSCRWCRATRSSAKSMRSGDERAPAGWATGWAYLGWPAPAARAGSAPAGARTCASGPFTGYTVDGGFADCAIADGRYCLPLPEGLHDVETAPLLCAGLIGYRALRMAGRGRAAGAVRLRRGRAHLVAQIARAQGRQVYAFTRARRRRRAAAGAGAWRGVGGRLRRRRRRASSMPRSSSRRSGELVPRALRAVAQGGTVVCGGIHMSDIPSFPYALLWGERSLRSVANLTRADGRELLDAGGPHPAAGRGPPLPAPARRRRAR